MSVAVGKRTKAQRERDYATIAELYCKGWPLYRIAEAIGLSSSQLSYDLAVIRDRWKAWALRDYHIWIHEQLAKLDNLEQHYWEAWSAVTPVDRTAPQYLTGVMGVIDRRCKLLGLYIERHEVDVTEHFDLEQWKQERAARLASLEEVEAFEDDATGDADAAGDG